MVDEEQQQVVQFSALHSTSSLASCDWNQIGAIVIFRGNFNPDTFDALQAIFIGDVIDKVGIKLEEAGLKCLEMEEVAPTLPSASPAPSMTLPASRWTASKYAPT